MTTKLNMLSKKMIKVKSNETQIKQSRMNSKKEEEETLKHYKTQYIFFNLTYIVKKKNANNHMKISTRTVKKEDEETLKHYKTHTQQTVAILRFLNGLRWRYIYVSPSGTVEGGECDLRLWCVFDRVCKEEV